MPASAAAAIRLAPLLLFAACAAQGPVEWDKWRDTYPAHYDMPLAEKAERIERHLLGYHLSPEGILIYHRRYTPLDPARPDAYRNHSDQPIWTGALAAAYAHKYERTKDARDRARLVRVLEGVRLLHDVTGKSGLLARSVIPLRFEVPARGGGEWHRSERYHFRGDASRDQYCGVLFGYASVLALLGDDAELHALIRPVAVAIADHIWENGRGIVGLDGKRTKHGNLNGWIAGVPVPPNAGVCLGFQKVAARLTGEARFTERYRQLVAWNYPQATRLIRVTLLGRTNYNNDNMTLMVLHALSHLEEDPAIRAVYDKNLARFWEDVRGEGNSFAHAVYASRRELPADARRDLFENLRLYPVDMRLYDQDLTGDPRVRRSLFGTRNRRALPLHVRMRSSFYWKSDPYALKKKAEAPGGEESVSGLDFLLAYWMASSSR